MKNIFEYKTIYRHEKAPQRNGWILLVSFLLLNCFPSPLHLSQTCYHISFRLSGAWPGPFTGILNSFSSYSPALLESLFDYSYFHGEWT